MSCQLQSQLRKAIRFERFEDVVVVVGGSDMERIYVDDGLTYLETQFENFDLTGLSMIWHYRDHPSIRAQAYMYVLDTSTVGPGFPQKFQSFAGTTYAEYRGLPRPASNVCVFGRGILEAYAENFDTPLTKQEPQNRERERERECHRERHVGRDMVG